MRRQRRRHHDDRPGAQDDPGAVARDIDVNLTGAFRTVQACLGGCASGASDGWWWCPAWPRSGVCPDRSPTPRRRLGSWHGAHARRRERTVRDHSQRRAPGLVATEQVLAMPARVRERALAAAPAHRSSPRRSPRRFPSSPATRPRRSTGRRSRSTAGHRCAAVARQRTTGSRRRRRRGVGSGGTGGVRR